MILIHVTFKSRITNAKILKRMNVISLVCFTVSNDFILFILKLNYVIKKISYLKDYLNQIVRIELDKNNFLLFCSTNLHIINGY